jgi:hypothetical protein
LPVSPVQRAQSSRTSSRFSVTAKFVFGNWQSTKKVDFLMPVLESGYSDDLFVAAQCYLSLGYSVIPVYGNLDIERAKVCPIPWTYFQQRRATNNDLRNWFTKLNFGGVAIITGRISSLVALDFDDPALARDFARRFPELTETWTVQSGSRHLPHYYYRLLPNLNIPSQKREGVDLQSGGRYIVAPPTTTTTMEWRTVRGGQPKMLTERDVRRLNAFMGTGEPETTANTPVFVFQGISSPDARSSIRQLAESNVSSNIIGENKGISSSAIPTSAGDYNKLAARYLKLVLAGRNEALFQTAIWARDYGWREDDVKRSLVGEHIRQMPGSEHHTESPEQRHREALRTIESAFSRPPRTGRKHTNTDIGDKAPSRKKHAKGIITNNIREALLKRRETAALRVLEALILAGYQPGRIFTAREARDTARHYAVGDWSVRKALQDTEFFTPPPETSANLVNTATNTENTEYKKCFFVNQPKPTQIQTKGRPSRYYMMPDKDTLCRLLQIQPAPAIPASADDLRSARTYRQSVLRELVKRRPGNYSREWLAELLGVSANTTRRYTQDTAFKITPTYSESVLLWQNVDSLVPPDVHDARPGSFLEDAQGRQYPPMRLIAQRLLRKSGIVRFKWRGVNHYGYANNEAQSVAEIAPIAQHTPSVARSRGIASPPPPVPITPELARSAKPHSRYSTPLADARLETAAQRIYHNMGQLDSKWSLSLTNARALVTTYGEMAVENLIVRIQTRDNVRNPVGLLTRLLSRQYAFMGEEKLTIAEIYVAELAFRVTCEINPEKAISWQNACKLARQYGQVAIERAVTILRKRQVNNPAGFLIKILKTDPSLGNPHAVTPDQQFVEHVYHTLRQMNPQRALSRKLVYRLIAARGRQAVTDALHIIKQRGNVQNPAGFLVILLRAQDVVRKQKG